MKSCIIYKTFRNEYKIVSQCETKAGYFLSVAPVYILPTNCSDNDLFKTILNALNNSDKIVETPKRNEISLVQKKLLSELREKSFPTLYMKSTSCEIRVENGILTIYPYKLLTDGKPEDGLYWVEDDKVVMKENTITLDSIVPKIKNLLLQKYY